mmetsp:Transcript_564/g.1312  ORF Transcript_564/g.1312 Transcript_564/m.1312 type:complete len:625 (-) Transcript_564:227-2101(-)
MVFGRRNKNNVNDNPVTAEEGEAYNPPEDASESHKESAFEDEKGDDPINRTTDNDDSSGSEAKSSDPEPAASSDKVTSPASILANPSKRNMTILFLFVLGIAMGFFTVFGLGSRQDRNNNDDDVRSSSALADEETPTMSPTPDNGGGGDLFVDTTASPSTLRPTTAVPTLAPIANEPSSPSNATLAPTAVGSSNETMSPSLFNQTDTDTTGPTTNGTTAIPTLSPTATNVSTLEPTVVPTLPPREPTSSPTTVVPSTLSPTKEPTSAPTTLKPTLTPTVAPTTQAPTTKPTEDEGTPSGNENEIVYGLQPNCYNQDFSKFNMCLDLSSASGVVEDWFPMVVSAAQRWEQVIAADRWGPWAPTMFTTISEEFIATERPAEPIDDMYLGIIVGKLDGSGGRFAEAGPDRLMSGGRIVASSILIDEADLQNVINNEIFEQLMLHEMGHCLGMGTLWSDGVHYEGTTYIGANGVKAWNDMGCTGPLPMAKDVAHWNDDCFTTEVGTHYLKFRQPVHISSVTLGALEDLGYAVNREEEDAYGLSDLGDCGDGCPAASNRLRRLRSTSPELSAYAEQSLLKAAAERFRRLSATVETEEDVIDSNVVSYVYEENGNYLSRVIHRHQVEHLI